VPGSPRPKSLSRRPCLAPPRNRNRRQCKGPRLHLRRGG
jgi:hypothetical protein